MKSLEQRCVNTIRTLSMDGVQKANSGHPGMPMGMADVAFVLWTEFLKHDPSQPQWLNRDRFILSAGHGSMLLYSLLHLTGYDLSLEELKNFRQWGSKTPGHPEVGLTPGVEMTTGPLGQGFATGVGMAIAALHLGAKVNTASHKVIDHKVYAIVSDGDLMEGVSQEAASIAGHLKLNNLIYFYDDNGITIDGSTELAFTEDVQARFRAYGWATFEVNGHDRNAIRQAIIQAHDINDRPVLIACKTKIGFGSPAKEGTSEVHGAPLGADEITRTKEFFELPDEPFWIDSEVLSYFRKCVQKGQVYHTEWQDSLAAFKVTAPERYNTLQASLKGRQSVDIDALLPVFPENPKGLATRKSSSMILDAVAPHIPGIMGGSADLGASNLTEFKGSEAFTAENRAGNYLNYGIREHAMGSIMNGLSLHGSVKPFGGTFLIFSDYCRPAIRLAAIMHQPVVYVFTHDSIGLGEDGPTHQPIEQLAALRAIPNTLVIRPADGNETAAAWKVALTHSDGPVLLALTRQNLPEIARTDKNPASLLEKGAYILADAPEGQPEAIIIATGSEVSTGYQAWQRLTEAGKQVRLVSMPSWELFRLQSIEYRDIVLPPSVKNRVSIEAGTSMGWHQWVGDEGRIISLDRFGESAPYQKLFAEFGFTADAIIEALGF
jgi:transketolase